MSDKREQKRNRVLFDWHAVWERKGNENTTDMKILDGYDHTVARLDDIAHNIVRAMNIQEEDHVLEVGCGAGGLAQYLKCNYVGVDYSRSLLAKHIKLLGNSVLHCEANDLMFKDKAFDKVFCYGVFQYLPSWQYAQQAIKEMKRVASKSILIGDLPTISHREEHMLYNKRHFKGWKIMKGDYNPLRFNVLLEM